MKKTVYEKPAFEFNDLYLFDGVANKCWGYMNSTFTIVIYRDKDHNDAMDGSDYEESRFTQRIDGSSCNDVYNKIVAACAGYDTSAIDSRENALSGTNGTTIFVPIS